MPGRQRQARRSLMRSTRRSPPPRNSGRNPAVRSGRQRCILAQVAGGILRIRGQVQNPDKDAVARAWNNRATPTRSLRFLMRRCPGSVYGRCSRRGAGRTPRVGAAAQAASGSRFWCHPRGRTAPPWRPPHGRRQIDAQQVRAPLQRRRDRPAQIRRSGSCQVPTVGSPAPSRGISALWSVRL
jgi:hypothetical protein